MSTSSTKRKIADTLVGAGIGAAIAGPIGAVAGGLVGSQVATSHAAEGARVQKEAEQKVEDPLVHAALKRILVPIDFSSHSRRALVFTAEWAARFGSEVSLLHVIEPVTTYGLLAAEPMVVPLPTPDFHEQARAELEKLAHTEFPDASKVSVHLRDGVAYDEITKAAHDLGADLIIIPTHGRTGLSHVLLGSTAERVVRHASCPVLTLRCAGR